MNLENSYPHEHWEYNVLTWTVRAWTHYQNREQNLRCLDKVSKSQAKAACPQE